MSVYDKSFYDLLGVSPSASDDEIKKAYKKKAFTLHPDRNKDDPNATERFQQLNSAYEVLKDPQKRSLYDRGGPDAVREGAGAQFQDIFSFFGGGGGGRQQKRRTQDIDHVLDVSLEDLYNGKDTTLRIKRDIICPGCKGSGCQQGKNPVKCTRCGGRGQCITMQRMGNTILQQSGPCPECHGVGESIPDGMACKQCKAKKITTQPKDILVKVPPGARDGEILNYPGLSDEYPGCETGAFVVRLRQKKHDTFQRKNDDLLIKKKITLAQSLVGGKFVITHLDGRKILIETKKGQIIKPFSCKVVEREGMPQKGNIHSKGKLFIYFEVVFPNYSELSPDLKEVIAKVFPLPDEIKGIDLNDENTYTATLADSNISLFEYSKREGGEARREAYQTGGDEYYDEDAGTSCQVG